MDFDNSVTSPPLCSKGCGFYGSVENRNMCSKCYEDFLKSELITAKSAKSLDVVVQKPPNPIAPSPSVLDDSCPPQQSATSSSKTNVTVDSSTETPSAGGSSGLANPKIKNRCKNCNKKVGLTGFKCRCGHLFCGMHRYPKEHACTFDFKKLDSEILVKNNSHIKSDKPAEKI